MAPRRFRADLHIHTCLSPCAALDLYPRRIVEQALRAGLDIIAVTDHNAAGNAAAVRRAAAGTKLTVLPGMEISTEEDVHLLAVFEELGACDALARRVEDLLPGTGGPADFSRDQVLVDAEDMVTGFYPQFLSGSIALSVRDAADLVRGLGGLAIAAHVDREAFGLLGQLGFFPPGLELDALESAFAAPAGRPAGPPSGGPPVVAFSDAHAAAEIGRRFTDLLIEAPTLAEIRRALEGRDGRRVLP